LGLKAERELTSAHRPVLKNFASTSPVGRATPRGETLMKVFKILVGLVVLVIGITIIAGLASIGNKANHDQATSNRVAQVWSQVHVGQSMNEVRSILGKPDDSTHSESSDFEGGVTRSDSWMYGTLSGSTTYSVDFTNGVVDFKSTL
jgi:hypothetical protein